MSETIKKNNFIEIEFTGTSDGKVFDTTNPKEAEQLGVQNPKKIKPTIISVGNQMVLQGLDEALPNKELNKEYTVHLQPEKAFGKRNPQLIKTYNLTAFTKNNINPYPGLALQLDNTIARVLSVSGGRVMMDFNNPLAGKEVDYKFKIKKKITDNKEKINALQDFFFKQRFEFEVKDKKVFFKDKKIKPMIEMMAPKFKEMTGFEFEVEEEKDNSKKKEKANKEEDKSKDKKEEKANKEKKEKEK